MIRKQVGNVHTKDSNSPNGLLKTGAWLPIDHLEVFQSNNLVSCGQECLQTDPFKAFF